MRIPIQYALLYPERRATRTEPLDLVTQGALTFEEPDLDRFPCLSLAYEAASIGGTMPAALSGADEVAVEAFLARELQFDQIPTVLRSTMDAHVRVEHASLDDALDAERWGRRAVRERIDKTRMAAAPLSVDADTPTRSR